jgi:hypothetical protein
MTLIFGLLTIPDLPSTVWIEKGANLVKKAILVDIINRIGIIALHWRDSFDL